MAIYIVGLRLYDFADIDGADFEWMSCIIK